MGFLGAAVRKHQLAANPCDGNRLPRDEAREMVFLTQEEFALLHSCVNEHWQPLVEFLVASGARFGEATALTPGDIDLAEATVRIQRAWRYVTGGGYQLGPPKTREGATSAPSMWHPAP
jgi:integrase